MRPVTFARRAIRKARYLLEFPYSWLETREANLPLRGPMTHAERGLALGLRHHLGDGPAVVYDIGASYGDFALAMAKLDVVDRVVAFEPLPEVFESLQRRAAPWPRCAA